MEAEQVRDELIRLFSVSTFFVSEFQPLVEKNAGFYMVKDLPDDQRRIIKADAKFRFATLIYVYVESAELQAKKNLPIVIRMHFGIAEGSSLRFSYEGIGDTTRIPTTVESSYEYYYNIEQKAIVDRKGKPIAGERLLISFYEEHTKFKKSVHYLFFRFRQFLRFLLIRILEFTRNTFYFLSLVTSGNRIEERQSLVIDYMRAKPEIPESVKKQETTVFYNITVKPIPLFAYSFLAVSSFATFYLLDIRPDYIRMILKYNFLTVVFAIVSYGSYEKLLGGILFGILRRIDKYYQYIRSKNFIR